MKFVERYALIFVGLVLALWVIHDQLGNRHRPTAAELYGCTVEQEAPNGECK